MNSLRIEDKKIIYSDAVEERVLLDFRDYLSNKSRLPLLGGRDTPSLMNIFQELLEDLDKRQEDEAPLYYLILDALLAKQHMFSPGPKRVLLLGGEGSIAQAHYDALLSGFHPFSVLFSYPSELLYQNLGEDLLDLILIMGFTPAQKPDLLLKNGERLMKRDGKLILFAPGDPLLNELFCMSYPEREEFSLIKDCVIRVADRKNPGA